MKTITLSADEKLIAAAEERARARQTTLNDEFRLWLEGYASQDERLRRYDEAVNRLCGKVRVGKKLTRDEMNER